MTEEEKMLAGKIYDPNTPDLIEKRERAHILSRQYNETDSYMIEERKRILDVLVPNRGENSFFTGPVFFDYGIYTTVGKNFYANFNFTCLDCARVIIGDNVYCGPNVSIYTAAHPLVAEERRGYTREDGVVTDKEYAKEIRIGNDCWLGGNVVILPGVTIGNNCVIGAGSVVTKDIPDNSLAVGNPCRVVRTITKEDSIEKKKLL